jgi:hypothetical protein
MICKGDPPSRKGLTMRKTSAPGKKLEPCHSGGNASRARRCSIGEGDNEQQALVYLIQEHNILACTVLTLAGYNGDHMKLTAKPAASTPSHTGTD